MLRRLFFWATVALTPLAGLDRCPAQESDAVISSHNWRPITIFDQIADPAEKRDLLALYDEREIRRRLERAEAFLAAYTRSAFLAQAYEIAAKASIDLEDTGRALKYGHESLRLLPENPSLLVLLANLQARQGLTRDAKQSARDALDYLDRFGPPSAIPEQAWPPLERQLKASSYFALGRAEVLEALSFEPGARRNEQMQRALEVLSQANSLNPADPEIPYLIGLSYSFLGQREEAARSFVAVYRMSGEMRERALAQLRKLYELSHHGPDISFDAYVAGLKPPAEVSTPGKPQQTVENRPRAGYQWLEYAGSNACRACHTDIHRNWSHTGMARMLRPYRPEDVMGDFSHHNEFYADDEVRLRDGGLEIIPGPNRRLFARMLVEGGRHYFQIMGAHGQWHRYPVDYVIGSKWQQAYATRLPNGQIHVFPIQYNLLQKRWINFWRIIDVRGSERADPSAWERLDISTGYQTNCAPCHTSQLRSVTGGAEPDHIEFREPGVDCEMCHGPSSRHVAAVSKGEFYNKQPLDPPVDFTRISSRDSVAICAQCHMQSALRESAPRAELNNSRPRGEFFPRSKSRPLVEFSRRAFYPDGRLRESTFMVESMLRTACFRKGSVTCVSCHDPHRDDASSNRASLRFPREPDRMCLQCHSQLVGKVETHTHHPLQSEASRCVSCHMPRIMYALLFKARSHQFDDFPDADRTLQFGQEDSPNACLLCHQDKNGQWLKQRLVAWARP